MAIDFTIKHEACWAELIHTMSVPTGTWRFQRPVINERKCCLCGWCHIFCPTGSILEKAERFIVDLDYCKGCGVCSFICPNAAIRMVKEPTE
jgi:pyruvate ferredoxin oxidoreductase delta subunit